MRRIIVLLLFLMVGSVLFAWEVGVYNHNSETYIASPWQKITFQGQQIQARVLIDKKDIKFELQKNLFADNWTISTKTSGGTTHQFKATHIEPGIITVNAEDSDRLFADLIVGVLVVLTSDEITISKRVDYGWVKVDPSILREVWR